MSVTFWTKESFQLSKYSSLFWFDLAAMSSYLFIVKYELPEVIKAFLRLEEDSGWVCIHVGVLHVCVRTVILYDFWQLLIYIFILINQFNLLLTSSV